MEATSNYPKSGKDRTFKDRFVHGKPETATMLCEHEGPFGYHYRASFLQE